MKVGVPLTRGVDIPAYFIMAATRSLQADNYRIIFSRGYCRGICQRRSSSLRVSYCNRPSNRPVVQLSRSSVLCIPALGWSISRRRWLSKYIPRGVGAALLCVSRKFSTNQSNHKRESQQDQEREDSQPPEGWSWLQLIPGIVLGMLYYLVANSDPVPEVPFSIFLQNMLLTGEVEQLQVNYNRERVFIFLYPGAVVNGREVRPYGPQYSMTISGVDSFEKKLNTAQEELGIPMFSRIPVKYRSQQSNLLPSFSLGALVALIACWYLFRSRVSVEVKFSSSSLNPFGFMTKAKTKVVTQPSQIQSRFSEVAGMEEAKREVMEFVDYLKTPQRFVELGARIPKGALLHGPPGTGKTLLARAIAGEASVPFISIAGPDFVEMFAGVGSARVRDLFHQAKELSPCILYIDEVDAVGRSRQSGPMAEGTSEQENTLNQLLVEMDGIQTLEGVVVLASTNRVDILDQALLRPGRFDRQIAIDLPTLPERKAIFDVYLKKVLLEKEIEQYSFRLAALTPGKSGADIANIVNEAALHAARVHGTMVTERDFEYAIERVIAGMEKKSGLLDKNERQVVAYHEAGHALVGWLLEHTDPIMKVSIVPRTKGSLGFAQYLPSDRKLHSKEQLFDRMCMMLGGRAAESVVFKKITTGAQDDLKKVTNMAYQQVAEFGMSPVIGNVSFPQTSPHEPAKRFYSDKLAHMIDEEVRELVAQAHKKAETLIQEHSLKLEKFAVQLLEKEVLNYADILTILGPMPFDKKRHHLTNLEELW